MFGFGGNGNFRYECKMGQKPRIRQRGGFQRRQSLEISKMPSQIQINKCSQKLVRNTVASTRLTKLASVNHVRDLFDVKGGCGRGESVARILTGDPEAWGQEGYT